MKLVGRSKVSKMSPKPTITYPFVRLPPECRDVIGKTVSIYETEHEGRRAFMLVLGDETPLSNKVIQPTDTTTLESRVCALETGIKEIKVAIMNKSPQTIEETVKDLRPGRNSNPSRLRDRQS